MDRKTRREIKKRSGGQCEVYYSNMDGSKFRCPNQADHIHHMITKARGGHLLDEYTDYHLIHVCWRCHNAADGGEAYDGGLLINGRVMYDKLQGRPVYSGTDDYLTVKFGDT